MAALQLMVATLMVVLAAAAAAERGGSASGGGGGGATIHLGPLPCADSSCPTAGGGRPVNNSDFHLRDIQIMRAGDGYYYLTVRAWHPPSLFLAVSACLAMNARSACSLAQGTSNSAGDEYWTDTDAVVRMWRSKSLRPGSFVGGHVVFNVSRDCPHWPASCRCVSCGGGKPGGRVWAPEVHYLKKAADVPGSGGYFMSYHVHASGCGSGVLKSTSGHPFGPYTSLVEGVPGGDVSLFQDPATDNVYAVSSGRCINAALLSQDMRSIVNNTCISAECRDECSNTTIGFEGPFVLFHVGTQRYFLSSSAFGNATAHGGPGSMFNHGSSVPLDSHYSAYMGSSPSFLGPYTDARGHSGSWLAVDNGGHNSYFYSVEGKLFATLWYGSEPPDNSGRNLPARDAGQVDLPSIVEMKLVAGRLVAPFPQSLSATATIKTDDDPHGTISLDPNSTIATMPSTHAGLIMEGVNHALYGYGLGSQMLFGEGFEEPAITDCTAHNAPCHGPFPEQWSLIGGNASLTSTKAEVFTGKQALRVDGAAQLLNAGLHRLGIASTSGWVYEASFFYLYKADPPTSKLSSKLTVVLRTNELTPKNLTVVTSVTLAPTGGEWKRINVTLPAASRSFPNCSLAIQIDGSSVLHVDAALFEPQAKHRWQGMHIRNDIAEAIDEAGLRFMRFGGDMAESIEPLPFGYTWYNQIGDPQRRPPKLGGAWYAWDSFGFGMFEVLEMAEKMGFGTDRQGSWGLMITLNYRVETPKSCALFVEFCFGGPDTKGGAMRIANGRSEPYKPFFVEIGNEQHGRSIKPYLKVFSAQVDAMMAVPSAKGKLKYMVGTSILTTYPDEDIKALFDYCKGKPCGYDWHIGIGNHSDIFSQMQGKIDSLQALHQLYQRMGTNKSEFVTIIGEENCDHWPTIGAHPGCHAPSSYYQDHMWGVALNRALEHAAWSNALQSPLGSMILASNPSSATGSWYTHMSNELNPNGPIGAMWLSANVQYTPTAIIVQPPMHAQSMIGHSQLPNVLNVQRSNLPSVNLSIAALASDDCDHLTIRVVNLNATAVTAAVAIAGSSAWVGTATQLSGKLDAHNSPEQPLHIVPTEAPVTAGQLAAGFQFDPYSFTVLNLTRLKTDEDTPKPPAFAQEFARVLERRHAGLER